MIKLFSLFSSSSSILRRSLPHHPTHLTSLSYIQSYQFSSSNIFVSKHYRVDSNELKDLLDTMETRYRKSNDGYELQVCNFCNKGNKHKESNLWKLKVNSDGSYHCYRCSLHGTWFDLKRRVSSCNDNEIISSNNNEKNEEEPAIKSEKVVVPDQQVVYSFAQQIQVKTNPNSKLATDYLTQIRKISKVIYLKYVLFLSSIASLIVRIRYGVGVTTQKFLNDNDEWEELPCLTFPWMVNIIFLLLLLMCFSL